MSALDDVKLKIKVLADQHRELHLDELLLPRLNNISTETQLRTELHHLAENIGRNPDPKYQAVHGHLELFNRVVEREINPLLEPLSEHGKISHSENDSHESEPGHPHKKHGHPQHYGHPVEDDSDKSKKGKNEDKTDENKGQEAEQKPATQNTPQRMEEVDEPDEDYEEEPSEEIPAYEPQAPMLPPPVENPEGAGHADAGRYGDDGSFTPQSDMGSSGESSAGGSGGDDTQNRGGNKKKGGGLPNPLKNQLNKLNPLNKINPLSQAKDILKPENLLKNALQHGLKTVALQAAGALWSLFLSFLGTFWPVLVALVAVVLIAVIVLWLLPSSVSVPVICGDFSDQVTHFQWAFYKNDSFNDTESNLYHINNHHEVTDPLDPLKDSSGHDSDLLNAESEILYTNCLLFGHGKGYLTGANNFTTFAKLLLGDRLDPSQDNGFNEGVKHSCHARGCSPSTYSGNDYLIDQDIIFDDDPKKSAGKCYTTITRDDKQQLIVVAYYNPEHCVDQELRYQIAESLSHVLIFQQEQQNGKGNADIFNSFKYGPLLTQKLPVYTCSDALSRPYGTLNFSPPSTDKDTGVVT
ncbi:MAG: hypothetical protein KGL95_04875, partial [Patescibacteria group bacterium]|nr:hypothetical protein [Patescibacteria group bacterium]